MKNQKVYKVVRPLFGLLLAFFGLNPYFNFFTLPEFNEAGGAFLGAMAASGYVMTLVSLVLVVVGAMYVFNKYVALGNLLLLPMSINFVLFHAFLDSAGAAGAVLVLLLNFYMIWMSWGKYEGLMKA